jgi:hypothetical protein
VRLRGKDFTQHQTNDSTQLEERLQTSGCRHAGALERHDTIGVPKFGGVESILWMSIVAPWVTADGDIPVVGLCQVRILGRSVLDAHHKLHREDAIPTKASTTFPGRLETEPLRRFGTDRRNCLRTSPASPHYLQVPTGTRILCRGRPCPTTTPPKKIWRYLPCPGFPL